jgi:solute:Na+ symporter, SSS family
MQFMILLLGVLVFSFYQFNREPVFFNQSQLELLAHSKYKDSLALVNREYDAAETIDIRERNWQSANPLQSGLLPYVESAGRLQSAEARKIKSKAIIKRWLGDKQVGGDNNDTNYIFLRFVTDYLPKGLVGLLIAVIFLAAWGSVAAALNSLASCTIVDFHKRFSSKTLTDKREYDLSRFYTFLWGIFCVAVAELAYNIGNSLIEAVNVLGSLFYGVILGIFLVAFYRKRISGTAVFTSAILVELGVVALFILNQKGVVHLSFLWLNAVGAIGVILFSELIQLMRKDAIGVR